ncbi:MAG TPA: transcriptional regulator, partial [Catenuloplanes sp.]
MNDGVVMAVPTAERVLDLFHGARLTPTQRRIAHCLVQHAGSAAYLSASEVAALAGVSQPSVTRFATALGYDGYPALRRRLREATAGDPTGEPGDAHDPVGSTAGGNGMQRAVLAEADNLRRLAEQLSHHDAVTRAAALLVASRPLPVLGLRAA